MNRITVLLADDHKTVREGLRTMLEAEPDIEIVGEAENGRQAVELSQKFCPDVVVMDLAMPILDGLEATRIIRSTSPGTKVIILSLHDDDTHIEQATDLGAAGYLLKQSSMHLLSNAVRDVQKGHAFFCPPTPKRLRNRQPKPDQHQPSRGRGAGQSRRPASTDSQPQNPS
jgi:DNA-binding NarL/FixJ family response regulator